MSDCYRPTLPPGDSDVGILRAFAEEIDSGGVGGASASRQRHVIEIIDEIYASSSSRSAMKLETR